MFLIDIFTVVSFFLNELDPINGGTDLQTGEAVAKFVVAESDASQSFYVCFQDTGMTEPKVMTTPITVYEKVPASIKISREELVDGNLQFVELDLAAIPVNQQNLKLEMLGGGNNFSDD